MEVFLPIWQRLGTVDWLLDIVVLKVVCERHTLQTLIFLQPDTVPRIFYVFGFSNSEKKKLYLFLYSNSYYF